jgi:hypothetical protein
VTVPVGAWQRSSTSSPTRFVEVSRFGDEVALRDGGAPEFVLVVGADAFDDFLAGARAGEFDRRPVP